MQDFDQLKHASQQTRNVWLTYLGLIAYLGIAVAAVRDIDFFSVNASVQLPLVGVNVPSLTFMWAGATVLFAVFIYLHIFTEKLIISISQASTGADNSALENAASAWLVADLVYSFRVKSEGESQWQSRTNLWILGVSATLFLNWAAGILLILAFFYRSLPAQNIWLSGYLAVIFSICVVVSSESARAFLFVRHDMRTIFIPLRRILFLLSFIIFSVLSVLSAFILTATFQVWGFHEAVLAENRRFLTTIAQPVAADLRNAHLTARPNNWMKFRTAMTDYYQRWCARPDTMACEKSLPSARDSDFLSEWMPMRGSYLVSLEKPVLTGRRLQFANLQGAFMANVMLESSDLRHATLDHAELEGAILAWSDLTGASLMNASLEIADLRFARFVSSELGFSTWGYAFAHGVVIEKSRVSAVDFSFADLSFGYLSELLAGASGRPIFTLKNTILEGAAFRRSDMSWVEVGEGVSFLGTFGDGSVALPPDVRAPCHWSSVVLEDEEFFGSWRGVLDARGNSFMWAMIAPADFHDVASVPISDVCRYSEDW